MRRRFIFLAPLIPVVFLLFIALGGLIVRELWNWLLPTLFGLPHVTFWQALGLLALCRILFGGLGMPGSHSGMRRRMAGRWESMTPEERERFKHGIRARWGAGPAAGDQTGV